MGENKHIKELDAFAKKYIQEIEIESPSKDFTSSLMQTLLAEQKSSVFKTTPLISKKVWVLIFGLIIAAILIPFGSSEKSLVNFPKIDFSFFDKIQMPNLFDSIALSNTVLYSIFFFGLMILVQIIFLKNHFNKRFD
jgi:hypothetical protein